MSTEIIRELKSSIAEDKNHAIQVLRKELKKLADYSANQDSQQASDLADTVEELTHKKTAEFNGIMTNCERLTQEKSNILKQCSDMVTKINTLSEQQSVEVENLKKLNHRRISVAQEEWRANRNKRQEDCLSEQYRRIEEMTFRAMQPDFSRLSSNHNAEMNRILIDTQQKKEEISKQLTDEYNSRYSSESSEITRRTSFSSYHSHQVNMVSSREKKNRQIIQQIELEKEEELRDLTAKLSSELTIIQQNHSNQVALLESSSRDKINSKKRQISDELSQYRHLNDGYLNDMKLLNDELLFGYSSSVESDLDKKKTTMMSAKMVELTDNRKMVLEVHIKRIESNHINSIQQVKSRMKVVNKTTMTGHDSRIREWTDMMHRLAVDRQLVDDDRKKMMMMSSQVDGNVMMMKNKIKDIKKQMMNDEAKVNGLCIESVHDVKCLELERELDGIARTDMNQLTTNRLTYRTEVAALEEGHKGELSGYDDDIRQRLDGLDGEMARLFQQRLDEEAKLEGIKKILAGKEKRDA